MKMKAECCSPKITKISEDEDIIRTGVIPIHIDKTGFLKPGSFKEKHLVENGVSVNRKILVRESELHNLGNFLTKNLHGGSDYTFFSTQVSSVTNIKSNCAPKKKERRE